METKLKTLKFLLIFALVCLANAYSNINSFVKSTSNDTEKSKAPLYPFIYFDLKTEGFFDSLKSKEKDKASLFYTQSDLQLDLNLNRYFSIHTNFALQKIKGAILTPTYLLNQTLEGEKPFFGNSLLTKELSLFFNFNRSKIYIGKISPKFGAGSERWSKVFYNTWYGISGTNLNQGYALDEKLGFLFDVEIISFEDALIRFQGAFFRNDNSKLYKKPFFTNRDIEKTITPLGFKKRQAGNTVALKSHSLNIDGFFGLSNRDVISFGVGYKNQFSDDLSTSERGFSTSAQYTKTFLDDLVFSIFAENATIWNAYAINDFKENYNTVSLSSSFAGFRVGVLQNYYRGKYQDDTSNIEFREYFIGFEIPKTEFGFFVSRKEYSKKNNDLSGFSVNIRYRIK
jgi:hypothetical protein